MPRKHEEPTLNVKVAWDSAVYGLQMAYDTYKRAALDELQWTFVDSDGYISILAGYEDRRRKTQEAQAEVERLMELVGALRTIRGEYEHE